MWPFASKQPPVPLAAPTADELRARIERVEDHYARLERRFVKLQGEFTAYMRDRFEEDDEDELEEQYSGE